MDFRESVNPLKFYVEFWVLDFYFLLLSPSVIYVFFYMVQGIRVLFYFYSKQIAICFNTIY